jgi:UDP-2,3-diacylglucosamine hydrolase
MRTLFISDIHLSESRPDLTQAFIQFLQTDAMQADSLYILGDLFDFWIGDDDSSEFAHIIQQAIRKVSDHGVSCFFIHGNRDFLIGTKFEQATGMALLDEVSCIDLYGSKVVILHGDLLCLEDERYLSFRAKVHQPWLQWCFNQLPFFVRQRIVSKVQVGIKSDKSTKSYDIMDVTQQEVLRVMDKYHVKMMIHGHTHRPSIHEINQSNHYYTRIVLGDWGNELSYLEFTQTGYRLKSRTITEK